MPDISSWLGYCLISACCLWYVFSDADFGLNTLDFHIILLSLVSDADIVESELVLCLHLTSPRGWGIVLISSYYCFWYLMLISMFIYHYSISSFFTFFIDKSHIQYHTYIDFNMQYTNENWYEKSNACTVCLQKY